MLGVGHWPSTAAVVRGTPTSTTSEDPTPSTGGPGDWAGCSKGLVRCRAEEVEQDSCQSRMLASVAAAISRPSCLAPSPPAAPPPPPPPLPGPG